MGTDGVVEGFEISKHIVQCCSPCGVVLEVDQLTLEAAEEVLRNGVVIRVAAAGTCSAGYRRLPDAPGSPGAAYWTPRSL